MLNEVQAATKYKMDPLPPNDPNNNQNTPRRQKEVPHHGGPRDNRRQAEDDNPMGIMGDMRDAPAVVIMFLVGVASWLLRERCIC